MKAYLITLFLLILSFNNVDGQPKKDTLIGFVKDTITPRGSVAVTGLVQTGDQNRTVASLLSVLTFGNHKYEIEPLTSIAYSTKPGKKVEEEYLENIILRYRHENRVYPAIGLSFDRSFLRKIDYRYSTGLIAVVHIIKKKKQMIKIGLGYNHEFAQFISGAFVPPFVTGNNYYNRISDQLYVRLKSKNHIIKDKLILTCDFFYQASLKGIDEYRWTLIGGLDVPITKKVAIRTSAVSSYETFVATGVSRENFRLTYGLNVTF